MCVSKCTGSLRVFSKPWAEVVSSGAIYDSIHFRQDLVDYYVLTNPKVGVDIPRGVCVICQDVVLDGSGEGGCPEVVADLVELLVGAREREVAVGIFLTQQKFHLQGACDA